MTKSIIDTAREAGFAGVAIKRYGLAGILERFATIHRAAIIAELCAGVEMPEPVGDGFTRLATIGDTLSLQQTVRITVTDIPVYTADQMRETVAAAVVKERELCAKVIESYVRYPSRLQFANAIRTRSDKV